MDQEQIPPTPTPPEQTPPIRTISIPPSHTIRNWFIGSGVVIALLATAGLYFGMPWINSKLKNQETTNTTNTATEHASMNGHTEIITQDEIGTKCKNNTIKEHGEVVRKNDLIVYSTECIIKKHDNNSADSVIRYYVRDAAETFNRRIASTFVSGNGSHPNARILDPNLGTLEFNRLNGEEKTTVKNLVGADVPASTETDHTIGQRLISSNTQLTAIRYYSDTEQRSNITIANAQTKQIKTVTFENIGLDGLYLVAWSPDNKYLYVSGGMWEFTAPAALWKVDVATGAKTKYSNLTGFRFPIMAYPAHDVAYVLKDFDGDDMFNPTTRPISLYQFSLSNPAAPTVVATEQAQVAFSSLFRIQNNLFYQNQIAEENNEIKKYNLDTQSAGTLAKGDVWLLAHSENEPWMVIYNNDRYEIISTTGGKTYDIGKGAMSFGMRVPEDATEYILNIIGIVPKQ